MLSLNDVSKAVLISAKEARKGERRPLAARESLIAEKDWAALATVCKGEDKLLAALKVTDMRPRAAESDDTHGRGAGHEYAH